MTAPVLPASLAEVMEESCDSYTVGRDAARVGGHVFINLKRVLRKSAELLVVPVAPAFEIVGGLKVSDDGFVLWYCSCPVCFTIHTGQPQISYRRSEKFMASSGKLYSNVPLSRSSIRRRPMMFGPAHVLLSSLSLALYAPAGRLGLTCCSTI